MFTNTCLLDTFPVEFQQRRQPSGGVQALAVDAARHLRLVGTRGETRRRYRNAFVAFHAYCQDALHDLHNSSNFDVALYEYITAGPVSNSAGRRGGGAEDPPSATLFDNVSRVVPT